MKKSLRIMLIIITIAITAVGCGMSGEESQKYEEKENMNIQLTERQISLLEELGLPTNYEELSLNQKSAVESIETLLNYLEEKYGQAFTYVGYAAGDALEDEHLIAYPSEGSPDEEITVYRTYVDGEFHYEDNYGERLAKPLFEAAVDEFVSENVDITNAKIFCEVLSVNEDVTRENILKNVAGSIYIFLDEAYCTQEMYQEFLDECSQFLNENSSGMPCNIWILRTTEEHLESINKDNFENKLSEDIYSSKNECTVSSSGKISIY